MQIDSPRAIPSHPGVYDEIGAKYRRHRRPDRRIADQLEAALGNARTVCNVGAGTGAYEPTSRQVVALEPSREMLSQRSRGAVRGVAEQLPFRDGAFDAAMAILTVHHWLDLDRGLAEIRRVAERRIVLTFDAEKSCDFWLLRDYIPEIVSLERQYPTLDQIASGIEATRVETVWVPHDCTDGFLAAYWRRPERYLEPDVRECISALAQTDPALVERGIARLRSDLASGAWQRRYGDDLERDVMDWGYRLVICDPTQG
jgi:SAM-dependent methyltransferase